ncbi:MAG: glycosyltransferase family 2 protein [Aminipila sp.]
MKQEPLVSVIMGTLYKSSNIELLERAVNSILKQSIRDFELLICDDGSSCKAHSLLDQYAKEDERVKIIRCGNKFSLPEKLNACLNVARGNFIARMDDDDFAKATRLEKQIDFLKLHSDIAFVGCNVEITISGKLSGEIELPQLPTVKDFYITQPYIHPTLLFRKEILVDIGGYSENKHQLFCEDYDLLLRLYQKNYQGANLTDKLFIYSISNDVKAKRKMRQRWNEVITRYQRFRDLHCLPQAAPYIVKPILVGLLPNKLLKMIKSKRGIKFE